MPRSIFFPGARWRCPGQEVRHERVEEGGQLGLTCYSLLGLLSVTGLRVREVLNLKIHDVDLAKGILVIVGCKFGKSPLVPIHPSTQKVLLKYARQRNRALGRDLSYLFVSRRGNRLDGGQVRRSFYRLSRQVGLRGPTARHGPRLHDFRHRFAVRTRVNGSRSGQEAERRLPVLSTYLGSPPFGTTWRPSAKSVPAAVTFV